MFACYRRFSSTSSQRSGSYVRRLGIPFIYTYGAISLVELPIFLGLVHYTGIDWMQDLELRLRSKFGASTAKEDTWIHKASENNGGKLMAELASVLVLHKLFMVVRLPLAGMLAPVTARALNKSSTKWTHPHSNSQSAVPNGSVATPLSPGHGAHQRQDPMRRFGTPPNKRNKWFAWFF